MSCQEFAPGIRPSESAGVIGQAPFPATSALAGADKVQDGTERSGRVTTAASVLRGSSSARWRLLGARLAHVRARLRLFLENRVGVERFELQRLFLDDGHVLAAGLALGLILGAGH